MKILTVINLYVRSFIFSILSLTSMVLYSFVCVALRAFLPLRYRYIIVVSCTKLIIAMLKFICRVDYQLEGTENIPQDRAGIILSKHQSTWETFFLPSVFHEPAIILKRELLWVPFFGWGLATLDPIAINRKEKNSAMEQIIKKGKECLNLGRWILIFPEGTRIPFGKVGKYRSGGARLAVATGAPVIPVAHNAGKFWPRKKFVKYPGTIRVVIGPLIETQGLTPDAITKKAQNWIEETILEINA